MAMTLRLPHDLDQRLSHLAEKTGRAKSYYLLQALNQYLEDMEDLLLANAISERINCGIEKIYSSQEVRDEIRAGR